MANIKFGGGVADMRGKMNGQVFSRNQYGAYMRTKVTPKNPRTIYQVAMRAYLSALSKRWGSTLTDAQRAQWNAAGTVFVVRNIFGDVLTLNGIALYQQLNIPNQWNLGSFIDSPPASLAVTANTSLTIIANHTGPVLTISLTPTAYVGSEVAYIWATPALPPGRKFLKSFYRLIGTHAAAVGAYSIATLWTTRFGAIPGAAGQRIGCLVGVLNPVTGAVSPGIQNSTLVI